MFYKRNISKKLSKLKLFLISIYSIEILFILNADCNFFMNDSFFKWMHFNFLIQMGF